MLIPYLVLLCEFFENFRFFTNVDLRSIFTDIRSQYVEMARTNTFGKNSNSQIFCHSKICHKQLFFMFSRFLFKL